MGHLLLRLIQLMFKNHSSEWLHVEQLKSICTQSYHIFLCLFIYISAVKQLIVYVYCVYLLCIYKYTHIQYIFWKYLHAYIYFHIIHKTV